MRKREKIVVLTSGMDSYVALKMTQFENPQSLVIPVWYDLGLPFSEAERKTLPDYVKIRDFKGYVDMLPKFEVDGVFIFPSLYEGILYDVMRKYQPDRIVMGVIATDSSMYEDNTLAWMEEFNRRMGRDLLDFPLSRKGLTKKDVIQKGIDIGIDIGVITRLHTCRSRLDTPNGCGSCFSCMRKRSAMMQLGYHSPIPSPLELPSIRIAEIMTQYAQNYRDGKVTAEELEYMEEIIPMLERETGISDDIFKLEKHIRNLVNKDGHKIKELLEVE
ncbi:7-cyano-7-deazaguanine synthase [Vibrio owensii]|uniref:7-cyano-7-deazaguanine synthase n=1 Tax=Vibrio owensii TaxID=696485 RepID=UPI003390CE2F